MDGTVKFITVKEAANMLSVTQIHLRKLLKEGLIPYLNISAGTQRQAIRIEIRAIEEFIKNGGVK